MKTEKCNCKKLGCDNIARFIKDGNMIEITIFSDKGHHGIIIHKNKLLYIINNLEDEDE